MESRAQQELHRALVKFGDQVLLAGIDIRGYVSATTALTPETRLEVLKGKADSPPYIADCRFEVLHKHQYTERRNLLQALSRAGINADDNDDDDTEEVFMEEGMQDMAQSPHFLKLSESDRKSVTSAKMLFDKERRVNSDELSRHVGQPIIYGQAVQLRHVNSGMFLTVKKTAAVVERGALRLVLSPGHRGSWFSVASGFKTKAEGDRVLYGEVLSFQSVLYSGMGLRHTAIPIERDSMLPVETNVNVKKTLEITCGLESSCFKVLPHAMHISLWPREDMDFLPGCSAVRFVQRSTGGILCVTNGEVHFQEFVTQGLSGQSPRTPGNAIWQLQPQRVEWSGQPARYLTQYCLVHIFSGKYLGASLPPNRPADQDSTPAHLFITPDYTIPEAVWTLHPFVRSDDDHLADQYLSEESFAFLQHQASGCWLSELQEKAPRSTLATFTEVQHLPAVLEADRRDSYVMAMSRMPDSLLSKVAEVRQSLQVMTGLGQELRTFHKKIPDGPDGLDRNASYAAIVDALRDSKLPSILRRWGPRMTRTQKHLLQLVTPTVDTSKEDTEGALEYQLLCRESKIIDAMVDALDAVNLRMFFGPEGKQYVKDELLGAALIRFGTYCHRFFQTVCKGGTSIQNYLAKFAPKLQPHLGGSLKAADTFAAIYANNVQQVQSADRNIIQSFIDLIRLEGRYPRFISFLNTLCGSHDAPVPLNQNILVQELLLNSDLVLVKGALVKSNNGATDWQISWANREDGTQVTWMCSVLFAKHADDEQAAGIEGWERSEAFIERNPEITMFIYYIYEMQLLCSLCYGRNSYVQKVLLDASREMQLGLEFESLLAVVKSERMPYVLRTACLRLMLYLHVDTDPWEEIRLPRTSRLLDDEPTGSTSEARKPKMPRGNKQTAIAELRDVLVKYLSSLPARTCTGQASLTLMVVKVLERMFRLGIITLAQAGCRQTIEVLLSALTTVQPSPGGWSTIMETKAHICSTLEFCLQMHSEESLSMIFNEFKLARSKLAQDAGVEASPQNHSSGDIDDLDNLIAPEDMEASQALAPMDFKVTPAMLSKISSRLQDVGADSGFRFFSLDTFSPETPSEGPTVLLLELFHYDYPRLTERAARLVEKLVSKRRQLVRCMLDTLIVVDVDTSLMYRRCEELMRIINIELKWVAATDEKRKEEALDSCIACFKEMADMLVPTSTINLPVPDEETGEQEELTLLDITGAAGAGSNSRVLVPSRRTKVVHLSKACVRRFQSILHDLHATELAMRVLKLPLRRQRQDPHPMTGKPQMDLAKDIGRRELFGQVYSFLHHCAAVETPTGGLVHNPKIQAYLAARLDLFISHIGVLNLNVATTLSAIFKANPILSRRCINISILRRFVTLLMTYGEKKRTRWLSFLHNTVVVDGTPSPANQSAVLNLASENESEVLELCKTPAAQAMRRQLMAEGCHLVNTESGATAQGSPLAYHRQSVLLLADCALGGNPTLVVKASGFYSLQEVIAGVTLGSEAAGAEDRIPATTYRYVSSAYWRFLQNVYFETDTENTRTAVREAGNGIWSFGDAGEGEGEGGILAEAPAAPRTRSPLMEWVLDELRYSLDREPRAELGSDVKYPAMVLLPFFAFPALAEYFKRHYALHSSKLEPAHLKDCETLTNYIQEFGERLQQVDDPDLARERASAIKATRRLLRALSNVNRSRSDGENTRLRGAPSNLTGSECGKPDRAGSEQGSALSTTFLSSHAVHRDWYTFTVEVADSVGVYVCPTSHDCAEVRPVIPGGPPMKYASLYVMARIFSQPHHTAASWARQGNPAGANPSGVTVHVSMERHGSRAGEIARGKSGSLALKPLGWTYEEVVLQMAKLLANRHELLDWSEEMLVKMIRTLRCAVYLDDGHGTDIEYLQAAWMAGLAREDAPQEGRLLKWVQNKYSALGLAHCAIALMTSSKLSVQLEAIQLLLVLLQGGNRTIQEEVYTLLTEDQGLSEAWFAQVDGGLERCSVWLKQQADDGDEAVAGDAEVAELPEDLEEEEGGGHAAARLNDAHDPVAFATATVSLLTQLCEGHMQDMQLLMKDQWRNEVKQDLISECVALLANMQHGLMSAVANNEPQLPRLMGAIFQFLSEACMGPCHPIQQAIAIDSSFILLANRMFCNIVLEEWDSAETKALKATMLGSLLELMYSLLEGKVDEKAAHVQDMLDYIAVEAQMRKLYKAMDQLDGSSGSSEMQTFLRLVRGDSAQSDSDSDDEAPRQPGKSEVSVFTTAMMDEGASKRGGLLPDDEGEGAEDGKHAVKFMSNVNGGNAKNRPLTSAAWEAHVKQPGPQKPKTPFFSFLARHRNVVEVNDEEVKDKVAKTLLDMLFFMQKLRYINGRKSMLPVGAAGGRPTPPADSAVLAGADNALRADLDQFMARNTASIELLWNNQLEKVYFPLTEMCRQANASASWKAKVLRDLRSLPSHMRANPLHKGIELMRRMESVVSDLVASHELKRRYAMLHWLSEQHAPLNKVSFFMALAVLVLMLLTVKASEATWRQDSAWSYWTCVGLCALQVLVVLSILVGFLCKDFRLWRESATRPALGQLLIRQLERAAETGAAAARLSRNRVNPHDAGEESSSGQGGNNFGNYAKKSHRKSPQIAKKIVQALPEPPKEHNAGGITFLMEYGIIHALDLVCYWKAWYMLAQIVFACLAVGVSPFYITFQLSIFFLEFDAGRMLVEALSKAGMPLVKTSLMGMVVILVFAIGSFLFFDRAEENLPCETMYQCVAAHLITGLYGDFAGMYVGDYGNLFNRVPESITEQWDSQVRVLFVMIFFIIWAFVLSNIFTGQIVDAFAAIRQESEDVASDNVKHCLVCSLERFDFDKNPAIDFEDHNDLEHNALAYVYYLHYLRVTNRTEFKGYDTAVQAMLEKTAVTDRAAWLPISRSIALENCEQSHTSLEETNERQNDMLEFMQATMRKMDMRMQSIERRLRNVGGGGFGNAAAQITRSMGKALPAASHSSRGTGLLPQTSAGVPTGNVIRPFGVHTGSGNAPGAAGDENRAAAAPMPLQTQLTTPAEEVMEALSEDSFSAVHTSEPPSSQDALRRLSTAGDPTQSTAPPEATMLEKLMEPPPESGSTSSANAAEPQVTSDAPSDSGSGSREADNSNGN